MRVSSILIYQGKRQILMSRYGTKFTFFFRMCICMRIKHDKLYTVLYKALFRRYTSLPVYDQ